MQVSRTSRPVALSLLAAMLLAALLLVAVGAAKIALSATQVQAQTQTQAQAPVQAPSAGAYDLVVTPPVSYVQVKPAARITHTITIENTGQQTVALEPEVVDFEAHPQTGIPLLQPALSFPYFVSLEQQLQPLILEPKAVAQLRLTIAPPKDAQEREYPLSIILNARPAQPTEIDPLGLAVARSQIQSGSSVEGALVSNLIVLVSSTNAQQLGQELSISDIAAPKIIDSFASLRFAPILTNQRLHASAASGSASITNFFGTEVAHFELYPDIVLGFSNRPLRALDPTSQETPRTIDFTYNPPFAFGLYTITVQLQNDAQLEVSTTTVLALPLSVMVAFVIGGSVGLWYWLGERKKTSSA